jgi:ribosomal protein S18 acetylase RimI-like enzyme
MNDQQLLGSLDVPNEEPLSFCKGISEDQVKEVIYYANEDDSIKHFTSDGKRFQNKDAFIEWMQKDRSIYTLSSSSGLLAGVIWFGPKEMPYKAFREPINREEYGITFSIRIYGAWRGKHLARRFTEKAFAEYKKSPEYLQSINKNMWLETSADNMPAVVAYEKFGFKQVTGPDEHNKILMVLHA